MSTVCSSLRELIAILCLFLIPVLPTFSADKEKSQSPSPTWHLRPPLKAPSASDSAAASAETLSVPSGKSKPETQKASDKKTPPFSLYVLAEEPFWKSKSSAAERIDKGEVLVSVTSDTREVGKKKLEQLFLKAAGNVDVPWGFARERIQDYEKLKQLSPEHFVEVTLNSAKQELFIHGVAMNYHAKMLMQLFEELEPGASKSRLHFKVIRGSFLGMTGFVELEGIGLTRKATHSVPKTLFSMTAFYESEKLPLPSFLLSFGLEAVMGVVAKKMRQYLESELKKQSGGLPNQELQHDGKTSFSPNPTGDSEHLVSRTFSCLGDRMEKVQ